MSDADLQNHVTFIATQLTTGVYEPSDEDEGCSASDYLSDVLDIEYIVDSKANYLGARVLVAFGGPNIWINTRSNVVEGYWWGDSAQADFTDSLGLDDLLSELWECR
jgi:hypothetical protein